MGSKSYTIRLEADDSRVILPTGKVSGNSRISLSEEQIDKVKQYQYSVTRINYYNDKASGHPEEVKTFDQGELQHMPGEPVPTPDNDEEVVEVNGYKIPKEDIDQLEERVNELKQEMDDEFLDTKEEISDNDNDDIKYCNEELSSGGQCKREVDHDDETCWQH